MRPLILFEVLELPWFVLQMYAKYVNDALFLFVAHDVAPRAMSAKVKGFVQPQNWFVDFSSISME